MWKKTEDDRPEISVPPVSSVRPQPVKEQAVIGPSLVVKGDVSGDEDLVIQGQVEGKVVLRNNSVTVGRNGRVRADVFGKTICVEGTVQGNLFAEEKIVVRQTGEVKGNLQAPRVNLEDGAKFKGSIDMDGSASEKPRATAGEKPEEKTGSTQSDLGIKVGPSARP